MCRVHVLQGGNIVVDGVLASCHSDWFLDDSVQRLAPHLAPLLPAAYQVLLLRFLSSVSEPLVAEQALRRCMIVGICVLAMSRVCKNLSSKVIMSGTILTS